MEHAQQNVETKELEGMMLTIETAFEGQQSKEDILFDYLLDCLIRGKE